MTVAAAWPQYIGKYPRAPHDVGKTAAASTCSRYTFGTRHACPRSQPHHPCGPRPGSSFPLLRQSARLPTTGPMGAWRLPRSRLALALPGARRARRRTADRRLSRRLVGRPRSFRSSPKPSEPRERPSGRKIDPRATRCTSWIPTDTSSRFTWATCQPVWSPAVSARTTAWSSSKSDSRNSPMAFTAVSTTFRAVLERNLT